MLSFFEKHRALSLVVTFIIFLLIFYISSLQFSGQSNTGYLSYIYHFTAFSYLALFLVITISKGKTTKLILLVGILIAVCYSISDEIHQQFVPGRGSSVTDILIDSLGISLTTLAYHNHCRCKKKLLKSKCFT